MKRAAAVCFLALSALARAGEPGVESVEIVAPRDDQQLARSLHESTVRAALGHPGVTVCRQLLVGIADRDWVRGEVIEVQGHLISIRIDEPGHFPHILKGVSYAQGAVVWSAPALWTPCL